MFMTCNFYPNANFKEPVTSRFTSFLLSTIGTILLLNIESNNFGVFRLIRKRDDVPFCSQS